MKIIRTLLPILGLCTFLVACGGNSEREGEVDAAEVVESSPDYEDSDPNNNDQIDYVEQGTQQGGVTTNTTNYSNRADSLRGAGDTLVTPKYTDDEYEAAFSTSTTNPANQVEGGITPGNNQKKQ